MLVPLLSPSSPSALSSLLRFLLIHKLVLVRVLPLAAGRLIVRVLACCDAAAADASVLSEASERVAAVWAQEGFVRHCSLQQQEYVTAVLIETLKRLRRRQKQQQQGKEQAGEWHVLAPHPIVYVSLP